MNKQRGFTLLELLVVLVIVSIMLGVISFSAMPNQKQRMEKDAERIALLLQTAREEAIVRNRPIAFEAGDSSYHFLVRGDRGWEPLVDDDMLRERAFAQAPLTLNIDPVLSINNDGIRIVFGREPVDKPFVLTMSSGDTSVSIHADGIGHYTVE